jgi:hypothetical protein
MSYMPRAPAAVSTSRLGKWAELTRELDRWADGGRAATLWWRDDDAVAATPQLADLLRLAAGIPLALAVVPADAEPGLADALADTPKVAVLQHGWCHANHARHGKKSEYPAGRSAHDVSHELAAGKARLQALFGPRALPVMVPPWNRFAGEFLPLLPELGFAAISATPSRTLLPPGLAALDVHIDPVAWHRDRGFVGEPAALGALIGQLQAGRLGAQPPDRPIGLLTHHLVTDAATRAFIERLIAVTSIHLAIRWAAVSELLQ